MLVLATIPTSPSPLAFGLSPLLLQIPKSILQAVMCARLFTVFPQANEDQSKRVLLLPLLSFSRINRQKTFRTLFIILDNH
jgi:hypothetical protein